MNNEVYWYLTMESSGRGSGSSKPELVSSQPEVPEFFMESDTLLSQVTDFDRKWPKAWEMVSSKQEVVFSEQEVLKIMSSSGSWLSEVTNLTKSGFQ